MLIANPRGHYHFLKGIDPYSCGVIADPGHEIVFVTLRAPTPWRDGFHLIDRHLRDAGCDRTSLCSIQLRCPSPYSIQGFIDFNETYCQVLKDWDLYQDELNPLARTNVSPAYAPPSDPQLHAFGYVVKAEHSQVNPSLVIAGAGELRDGVLVDAGIIRRGDTSPESMHEKADYVMKVMEQRLDGLGARWDLLNVINVYTIYPIHEFHEDVILNRLGPARRMGIHLHDTRPPIQGIDFEMDMRGVNREIIL
ncbi:MAG: RidA family protein [Gemmatimonadetes bacterium]|jgi:hypothetical protein|nr:RidA family protein [Gemmatimonadota bacterium]MBT6148181.1 RidA family protein [Gemmatimonadota bacterium]MBT7863886.1 RidA family protein [Gemmatimonadota bacterium]